jgi:hypothetical protein
MHFEMAWRSALVSDTLDALMSRTSAFGVENQSWNNRFRYHSARPTTKSRKKANSKPPSGTWKTRKW